MKSPVSAHVFETGPRFQAALTQLAVVNSEAALGIDE